MENEPLSSAEKKELRGIAQRLKPHVHIGKQGLSETVNAEIETALLKNGLIKIRFEGNRSNVKSTVHGNSTKAELRIRWQCRQGGRFLPRYARKQLRLTAHL
jgi:RNA-binding protein YhbY